VTWQKYFLLGLLSHTTVLNLLPLLTKIFFTAMSQVSRRVYLHSC